MKHKIIKTIINLSSDRLIRFICIQKMGILNHVSDYDYIAAKYAIVLGKKISLDNPVTFNEKLQWLKIYDRKVEYTMMVDKYLVREYIKAKIGDKYLIPILGNWDSIEKIDFKELPRKFVIKCNHNSGLGMCICRDKEKLNIKKVKSDLKKGMKQNYYIESREWPYKDVQRKIIAEQYMEDDSGGLIDYKVHCFNGEPKFILVCSNRFSDEGLIEDFMSLDWEQMSVKRPNINTSNVPVEKPQELDEILELSKILSKDIPFVRVDFYIVNHKVYFSELTFYPASGFAPFEPDEWDYTFGSWLKLPNE